MLYLVLIEIREVKLNQRIIRSIVNFVIFLLCQQSAVYLGLAMCLFFIISLFVSSVCVLTLSFLTYFTFVFCSAFVKQLIQDPAPVSHHGTIVCIPLTVWARNYVPHLEYSLHGAYSIPCALLVYAVIFNKKCGGKRGSLSKIFYLYKKRGCFLYKEAFFWTNKITDSFI